MSDFIKDPDQVKQQSHEEWLADFNRGSSKQPQEPGPAIPEIPVLDADESVDEDTEVPALIPEGIYTAKIIANATQSNMFGGGKLKLRYEITNQGPHQGTRLDGWYNVTLKEDPKNNGRFTVRPMSKYRREFVNVLSNEASRRLDRLFPSLLAGIDLKVEVETVRNDSNGEPHVAALHYSKVKRIITKA